jgi:rhodanese-related sulfurtransferase
VERIMGEPIDFSALAGSLPRIEGILNLGPAEALDCLARGAVLVDLRETYETNFRVFDVAEVLYEPWSRFVSRFERLPRDRPLILADAAGIYCREAARILVEAGYSNVAKLAGGIIDWDAAGLPVRKDAEYELGGQCACKIKTRVGRNPLLAKGGGDSSGPWRDA